LRIPTEGQSVPDAVTYCPNKIDISSDWAL
jgi:hypothetical protein